MSRKRDILLIALSAAAIFGLAGYGLLKAPDDYSLSERRELAKRPKAELSSLESGRFMTEFESYSLDQFPFRDGLRTIKAYAAKDIFFKKDNNGIYEINGYLGKMEYPLNEARFDKNIKKINEVYSKFIEGNGCKVFLSVIPDKNYYLGEPAGYPVIDYKDIVGQLEDSIYHDSCIDISGELSIESFYKTDQHWKQEKILPVANALLNGLTGDDTALDESLFKINELENDFYGTYYGQSALKVKPDRIKYLTNAEIDACHVTSYATGKAKDGVMYDLKKAAGKDPYEIYLSGSEPFAVIDNPDAKTDKELVIFRDSFGGSLAPLLVSEYSKITLIDLRYVNSAFLGNLISFEGQDVLFLYSTLILNNTITM